MLVIIWGDILKIRLDYVTNSSSSSYIVAFKNKYDFDEETLQKYPFLKDYRGEKDKIIYYLLHVNDSETELRYEINDKEDLDNFCEEYYCWSGIKLEDWLKTEGAQEYYSQMKDYLDKGYSILNFDVGYHDGYLNEEIERLIHLKDDNTIFLKDFDY